MFDYTIGECFGGELMAIAIMAFSYRYVLEAITELSREKRRVQYAEIAERAGCSTKTVERAVKDLTRSGAVKLISKGKGYGYMFEVGA